MSGVSMSAAQIPPAEEASFGGSGTISFFDTAGKGLRLDATSETDSLTEISKEREREI